MQTNPKVTNIAVNGDAGQYVNIALTMLASKVEVMEDPTLNGGTPQGLQGYYIDPQPPQEGVVVRSPNVLQNWLGQTSGQMGRAYQPIVFGGDAGRVHGGEGNYVGGAGTVILQLLSLTATATGIILTEWP